MQIVQSGLLPDRARGDMAGPCNGNKGSALATLLLDSGKGAIAVLLAVQVVLMTIMPPHWQQYS